MEESEQFWSLHGTLIPRSDSGAPAFPAPFSHSATRPVRGARFSTRSCSPPARPRTQAPLNSPQAPAAVLVPRTASCAAPAGSSLLQPLLALRGRRGPWRSAQPAEAALGRGPRCRPRRGSGGGKAGPAGSSRPALSRGARGEGRGGGGGGAGRPPL